jgi:hypothetical protein
MARATTVEDLAKSLGDIKKSISATSDYSSSIDKSFAESRKNAEGFRQSIDGVKELSKNLRKNLGPIGSLFKVDTSGLEAVQESYKSLSEERSAISRQMLEYSTEINRLRARGASITDREERTLQNMTHEMYMLKDDLKTVVSEQAKLEPSMKAYGKAWSEVTELGDELRASMVALAAFTGVSMIARRFDDVSKAVSQSNLGIQNQLKLYADVNQAQLASGVSLDSIIAAQTAIVSLGLENLGNNKDNVKVVGMLQDSLGVSVDESAHLLAISRTTSDSFSKMADTISYMSQQTGVTANNIAKMSVDITRQAGSIGKVGFDLSNLTAAGSLIQGITNRFGGAGDEFSKYYSAITSARNLTPGAFAGTGAGAYGQVTDPKLLLQGHVKSLEAASSMADIPGMGEQIEKLFGVSQLEASLFKNNKDFKAEMMSTIDTYDETIAKQRQVNSLTAGWNEQNKSLVKSYDTIRSTMSGLLASALTPMASGLAVVAGWLAKVTTGMQEFFSENQKAVKIVGYAIMAVAVPALAYATIQAAEFAAALMVLARGFKINAMQTAAKSNGGGLLDAVAGGGISKMLEGQWKISFKGLLSAIKGVANVATLGLFTGGLKGMIEMLSKAGPLLFGGAKALLKFIGPVGLIISAIGAVMDMFDDTKTRADVLVGVLNSLSFGLLGLALKADWVRDSLKFLSTVLVNTLDNITSGMLKIVSTLSGFFGLKGISSWAKNLSKTMSENFSTANDEISKSIDKLADIEADKKKTKPEDKSNFSDMWSSTTLADFDKFNANSIKNDLVVSSKSRPLQTTEQQFLYDPTATRQIAKQEEISKNIVELTSVIKKTSGVDVETQQKISDQERDNRMFDMIMFAEFNSPGLTPNMARL